MFQSVSRLLWCLLTGMGFRPMIKIDSTLIQFNHNDSDSYKELVENIDELLKRMFVSAVSFVNWTVYASHASKGVGT